MAGRPTPRKRVKFDSSTAATADHDPVAAGLALSRAADAGTDNDAGASDSDNNSDLAYDDLSQPRRVHQAGRWKHRVSAGGRRHDPDLSDSDTDADADAPVGADVVADGGARASRVAFDSDAESDTTPDARQRRAKRRQDQAIDSNAFDSASEPASESASESESHRNDDRSLLDPLVDPEDRDTEAYHRRAAAAKRAAAADAAAESLMYVTEEAAAEASGITPFNLDREIADGGLEHTGPEGFAKTAVDPLARHDVWLQQVTVEGMRSAARAAAAAQAQAEARERRAQSQPALSEETLWRSIIAVLLPDESVAKALARLGKQLSGGLSAAQRRKSQSKSKSKSKFMAKANADAVPETFLSPPERERVQKQLDDLTAWAQTLLTRGHHDIYGLTADGIRALHLPLPVPDLSDDDDGDDDSVIPIPGMATTATGTMADGDADDDDMFAVCGDGPTAIVSNGPPAASHTNGASAGINGHAAASHQHADAERLDPTRLQYEYQLPASLAADAADGTPQTFGPFSYDAMHDWVEAGYFTPASGLQWRPVQADSSRSSPPPWRPLRPGDFMPTASSVV
ncbi:hypothetical protein CXG81DRAFT_19670 [Caulochytrium protostelioides]|uniref:GYF domain-containing protein n=1 Tax=Caulochytrium protostelioides TaxID=1555241 RepID=A0A4P9X5H5_9FUNG|nr:hypothetical protein CXG81DRAFT_19670 [Caulochytrium protostelioides]|eukprot:RKP00366.1 hypothetical protein CXG81DRAFT_19670 [Caulochytrium protostelioides]